MNCLRCGKQLPEGAVYCGYCGLELGNSISGEQNTGFSPQSSQPENSPKRIRPENQQSPQGFQPGNLPQGIQPGHQNTQQGFQPGHQNFQQSFQPGHQNTQQGFQPGHQNSPQSFQTGYRNPPQGFHPGNPPQGFQPGYQNPSQGFQPGYQNPQQSFQTGFRNPPQGFQPGNQNPPKKLKKKEKPVKKGKKTGSAARLPLPLVALLVLLAAASLAFVFVFYFFHLKPGKDLDALAAGWKRGEIGMVVGVSDGNPEEDKEGFSSKEDEEFYNNLIDEYGDMLLPENPEEGITEDSYTDEDSGAPEDSNTDGDSSAPEGSDTPEGAGSDKGSRAETSGQEKNPFLKLVLEHSEISIKKPVFIKYPCDTVVTVDGPDMVKLLEKLDYRSYENTEELMNRVIAELDKNSFETRKTEIPVQIEKEADGSLCLAEPSFQLADALYGGVLSLYAQEEYSFYESLFEQ